MTFDADKPAAYNPHETQRLSNELQRVADTDRHRSNELLMLMLENLNAGLEETRASLAAEADRRYQELRDHVGEYPHVSKDTIKNLIHGALMADRKERDSQAKEHYFKIFIKWVLPASGAAGFISELGHFFGHGR